MVLKANLKTTTSAAPQAAPQAAPKAAQPQFEDPDDDVMVADAPEAAEAAAPAPAQASKPTPTTTAVATRSAGAVAQKPKSVNMLDYDLVGLLQDRLPPVDFGEGVRLVGSNGQIMDGDKKLLGEAVVLTLLSWNDRWVLSPGENGAEAKEHARYSFDSVTTTKGEDVKEYLEMLRKEMGYNKAALKNYVDLFGILEESSKPTEHIGSAVSVSLSPDSVKALSGFRRDLVIKGMMGRLNVSDLSLGIKIKIGTEVKSGNGNTWTRLVFSLAD